MTPILCTPFFQVIVTTIAPPPFSLNSFCLVVVGCFVPFFFIPTFPFVLLLCFIQLVCSLFTPMCPSPAPLDLNLTSLLSVFPAFHSNLF